MFSVSMKFAGPVFEKGLNLYSEMNQNVHQAGLIVEREAKETIYAGHAAGHLKIKNGHLRNSLSTKTQALQAHVGSDLIYSRIHEKGGIIHFKTRAGSVTIPARPYLGPALIAKRDEVIAKLRKWITKRMGG